MTIGGRRQPWMTALKGTLTCYLALFAIASKCTSVTKVQAFESTCLHPIRPPPSLNTCYTLPCPASSPAPAAGWSPPAMCSTLFSPWNATASRTHDTPPVVAAAAATSQQGISTSNSSTDNRDKQGTHTLPSIPPPQNLLADPAVITAHPSPSSGCTAATCRVRGPAHPQSLLFSTLLSTLPSPSPPVHRSMHAYTIAHKHALTNP